MTKHRDVLRCPRCGASLASFDGLGDVDDAMLIEWRKTLDQHRPSCPNPATASEGLSARRAASVRPGSEDPDGTPGG